MSDWTDNNVNDLQKSNKAADMALSAYEEAMIRQLLKKKAAKLARACHANDSDPDTLSYRFGIFH